MERNLEKLKEILFFQNYEFYLFFFNVNYVDTMNKLIL